MSVFLILAYLFYIGSSFGWLLELVYRRFFSDANPERKWINPGFCVGPYVPLYGFGLCILFLLASFGTAMGVNTAGGRLTLFFVMALCMTAIEYLAGVLVLKYANVRLWDYSMEWGNFQGLICPKFSFFWALCSAFYYFFIHPHILVSLHWLAENLAFSFVIGYFFGIFTLDVIYSAQIITKMRAFAYENKVIIRYEHVKAIIRKRQDAEKVWTHFLFAFRSPENFREHLKNAVESWEAWHKDAK